MKGYTALSTHTGMKVTTPGTPSVACVMPYVTGSQARNAATAPRVEIMPEGSGRVLQRSTCLSRWRSQRSLQ